MNDLSRLWRYASTGDNPQGEQSPMGFFDTLRRVLSGADADADSGEHPRSPGEAPSDPHDDLPAGSSDIPIDSEATTPGPDIYDRLQWHKKLKRVLDTLPDSRA